MKEANEQLETAAVIKTGSRCEQLTGETSTQRAEQNRTRGQESHELNVETCLNVTETSQIPN